MPVPPVCIRTLQAPRHHVASTRGLGYHAPSLPTPAHQPAIEDRSPAQIAPLVVLGHGGWDHEIAPEVDRDGDAGVPPVRATVWILSGHHAASARACSIIHASHGRASLVPALR